MVVPEQWQMRDFWDRAPAVRNIITRPLQHALWYQIYSIFFLSQTLRPEMIEPWVFYPKCPHYITSHCPFIHKWNSHQGQRHLNKHLQPQPETEPSSSGPTLPPEPTFFICFDVETVFPKLLSQSCQRATVHSIKIYSSNRFFLSSINLFWVYTYLKQNKTIISSIHNLEQGINNTESHHDHSTIYCHCGSWKTFLEIFQHYLEC